MYDYEVQFSNSASSKNEHRTCYFHNLDDAAELLRRYIDTTLLFECESPILSVVVNACSFIAVSIKALHLFFAQEGRQ